MQKPDSLLLHSCRIYRGQWFDLSRAAAALSLRCEEVCGPFDLPPDCQIQQCHIIGEATAVATNAKAFKQDAERKAQEQWASYNARLGIAETQKRERRQAFLDQAKANDDWDLTGKWTMYCDELAQYSSGPELPEKLHMEIFRDDYKLKSVCVGEAPSEDPRRPRYCAIFHFGVVEGIMRIYPSDSTPSSPEWTTVKDNPIFLFRWRGRETGEGEIQLEALEYQPRSIKFSDSGTMVEGVFDCPYISGELRFTGTKKSHGKGQALSSAEKWRGLSREAWDEECRSRW